MVNGQVIAAGGECGQGDQADWLMPANRPYPKRVGCITRAYNGKRFATAAAP